MNRLLDVESDDARYALMRQIEQEISPTLLFQVSERYAQEGKRARRLIAFEENVLSNIVAGADDKPSWVQ
jgi:hypothetical protein